ncbi:DUF551 domain-containing protein [Geobacter sp.]|uniref:DUF551 domain-containing protein n=1 Tax=Geobacter sp. TaxID=46610 RepID=UPI002608160F|nr:DUF551 domain-containing protein [Geobacter sp.]
MEWISINERLPEDNTPVVLFTPLDFFGDLHSCIGNSESIRICNIATGREEAPIFTHWMPLPATPTVTKRDCR